MNWNNVKITIFKELRGIIRDKKSLHKLIIYPLIIPLVILLFGFLFDTVSESNYNVGVNYSLTSEEQSIVKDLGNLNFKSYNDKKSLEEAYSNGEIEGYIVKNNNKYTIYVDESENSGEVILSIANLYLESYSKVLANKYLIENQIDPNKVFNNITIETESLTETEVDLMAKTIFSLVIAYITMIIVMVCVVVVIDATSGEKERGTLETILTFPVKSSELVVGKYLATAILGFIGGLVAYLLALPAFHYGKEMFDSYKDIVFTTSFTSIILVILIIFLTALLSSGLCMALAGKSKSYKEAQSSLQMVTLLPIIPYFLTFLEIDNFIFNLIPIANCSALLNDIVINNINYQSLLVIIASTIIYIVAILFYISKQYKREETLFS